MCSGGFNDIAPANKIGMKTVWIKQSYGKYVVPNSQEEYPFIIANAYFHTIDELRFEVSESGFEIENSYAVEGCIWIAPTFDDKWKDIESRKRLLEIIHAT